MVTEMKRSIIWIVAVVAALATVIAFAAAGMPEETEDASEIIVASAEESVPLTTQGNENAEPAAPSQTEKETAVRPGRRPKNKYEPGGAYPILMFDVTDKELMIGFSDYTFIGTVVDIGEPQYTRKTDEGTPVYSVATLVTVQVEVNIKGELITEEPIQILVAGGPKREDIRYLINYDCTLPEVGETIVFMFVANEEHELVDPVYGGMVFVGYRETDPAEEFQARYDTMVAEYREAYENEDTTYNHREKGISIYDVNYKGE